MNLLKGSVLVLTGLTANAVAQNPPVDFHTRIWAPKLEGKHNSASLDDDSVLFPSAALSVTFEAPEFIRRRNTGDNRLRLRYEQFSSDSSQGLGASSSLYFRRASFDWDGLHHEGEHFDFTIGGSLQYVDMRTKITVPTLGGIHAKKDLQSLYPKLRLQGRWKIASSLSLDAALEEGMMLGSWRDQRVSEAEAMLRWKVGRGITLEGGYRTEYLALEDGIKDSQNRARLQLAGPVLGFVIRF